MQVLDVPFSEVGKTESKSSYNNWEAAVVKTTVEWIVTQEGFPASSIGIVTPYQAQVQIPPQHNIAGNFFALDL